MSNKDTKIVLEKFCNEVSSYLKNLEENRPKLYSDKVAQIKKGYNSLLVRTYKSKLSIDELRLLKRQLTQAIYIHEIAITDDDPGFILENRTFLDNVVKHLENALIVVSQRIDNISLLITDKKEIDEAKQNDLDVPKTERIKQLCNPSAIIKKEPCLSIEEEKNHNPALKTLYSLFLDEQKYSQIVERLRDLGIVTYEDPNIRSLQIDRKKVNISELISIVCDLKEKKYFSRKVKVEEIHDVIFDTFNVSTKPATVRNKSPKKQRSKIAQFSDWLPTAK